VKRLGAGDDVDGILGDAGRVGEAPSTNSTFAAPVAALAWAAIRRFASTPITRSAWPAQARAERPVPQPRSTTSCGRLVPAWVSNTESTISGGLGR
jgi:hypothetical protein